MYFFHSQGTVQNMLDTFRKHKLTAMDTLIKWGGFTYYATVRYNEQNYETHDWDLVIHFEKDRGGHVGTFILKGPDTHVHKTVQNTFKDILQDLRRRDKGG